MSLFLQYFAAFSADILKDELLRYRVSEWMRCVSEINSIGRVMESLMNNGSQREVVTSVVNPGV